MSTLFALLVSVVLAVAGCGPLDPQAAGRSAPARQPARQPAGQPARQPAAQCATSAPTTAAGYAAMFARLPAAQWAAGDTGITVPFGRRSIWLFGDTFSARPNGFVHSSAIVQNGGCLSVSHAGAQVLPNDPDTRTQVEGHAAVVHHIYWIESGHPVDATHIAVIARAIRLVPHWDATQHRLVYGQWDFHDGGVDRTALVAVSAAGELTFAGWTAEARTPPPDPGPLLDCEAPAPPEPGHFCYARHVHPELRLAAGRVLVTTSQGWDEGRTHPYTDYRLIFSSGH